MNDKKTKALVKELENEFPNIYDRINLMNFNALNGGNKINKQEE